MESLPFFMTPDSRGTRSYAPSAKAQIFRLNISLGDGILQKMADPKHYQRWLERVSYDMDTAKAMVQTGRSIYAVFYVSAGNRKVF